MADYFSSADYKKCSTRVFDPKIIEGYWKVERGEASQKEVLEEIGTSRNTFNRRIADYIGTESWIRSTISFLKQKRIARRGWLENHCQTI